MYISVDQPIKETGTEAQEYSTLEQKVITEFFEHEVTIPPFRLVARPVTDNINHVNLSRAIELAEGINIVNVSILEKFLSNITYKPVKTYNEFENAILRSQGYLYFLLMLDVYDKTIFETVLFHTYDYVYEKYLSEDVPILAINFLPTIMPADNLELTPYGNIIDVQRFISRAGSHMIRVILDEEDIVFSLVELMSYGQSNISNVYGS